MISSLIFEAEKWGVIEESALDHLGNKAHALSDMEKLRQLSFQNLVNEQLLLQHLSERYQIPLLTEANIICTPYPDKEFQYTVFNETGILLMCFGKAFGGLLSLNSNLLVFDEITYHFSEPLLWYWTPLQQIEEYRSLAESDNWNYEETNIPEHVKQLLETAVSEKCSDIHLEIREDGMHARMRIDGLLKDVKQFPKGLESALISKLKIMAGMDVAVKRKPQDGHYAYKSIKGECYDLRISTLPTESGEKLVLRLLDQTPVKYKLEVLNFFQQDLKVLREASQMTSGLILVVGPTGCGKTTTLYAILNEINSPEKNIITIEDPVEYHIEGINQVSVNPEHELSFAQALRSSLRQDPDVILVGEIRDEETASIAVRSALTGHLVLSTLHSTNAVTTIQRLVNLGVDIDILAETLKVILSQRLVRRRCDHSDDVVYCPKCKGSGYAGRIPLYEILKVNSLVSQRIRDGLLGNDLISPDSDLYFHSFQDIAEHLQNNQLTSISELSPILSGM